jgi:SAM-dependent methyltransferase
MPPRPCPDENAAIVELTQWFQTPAGEYVREWELARLDATVDDLFGFHAVQAGPAIFDALRANRIRFKAWVGPVLPAPGMLPDGFAVVHADVEALPFASQSVDLLVLPHALEYAADPHRVLREAERVLRPEGRLVITGFNPWSLWGARHRLGRGGWLPASGRFLSISRLKDWLKLLSFELDRGQFGCYAPPLATTTWLQRYRFLEKAGDRWWAVGGAIYMVSAVKRVHGMRLVGPAWKKKRRRAAATVAVNQHTHYGTIDE